MEKKHNYSIEKTADLYLAYLAKTRDKYSVQNRQLIYESETPLDKFLDSQNIFYNYKILVDSLELLKKDKLVAVHPNRSQPILYGQRFYFGAPEIECVQLTDEGQRFVQTGQVLDKVGQAEKDAEKKKVKERLINAIISFGTALLTIFIKWFFFDQK